jgi:hypothetical protein
MDPSMRPLPVEDVAAGLLRIKGNRHLRADRLASLVEHNDGPGGCSLENGKVIFTVGLAGDYGIAVPLVVTDQPDAGEGLARRVEHAADDVGRGPGTTGAGVRRIGLDRARR